VRLTPLPVTTGTIKGGTMRSDTEIRIEIQRFEDWRDEKGEETPEQKARRDGYIFALKYVIKENY